MLQSPDNVLVVVSAASLVVEAECRSGGVYACSVNSQQPAANYHFRLRCLESIRWLLVIKSQVRLAAVCRVVGELTDTVKVALPDGGPPDHTIGRLGLLAARGKTAGRSQTGHKRNSAGQAERRQRWKPAMV